MASIQRRHRRARDKNAAKTRAQNQVVDLMLFHRVPAPSAECEVERRKLAAVFQAVMKDWKAKSAASLWEHLQVMTESYDPKVHGFSRLVNLVEDVLALREVEKEELAKQRCEALPSVSSSAGAES